jgi:hypothetical protein
VAAEAAQAQAAQVAAEAAQAQVAAVANLIVHTRTLTRVRRTQTLQTLTITQGQVPQATLGTIATHPQATLGTTASTTQLVVTQAPIVDLTKVQVTLTVKTDQNMLLTIAAIKAEMAKKKVAIHTTVTETTIATLEALHVLMMTNLKKPQITLLKQ